MRIFFLILLFCSCTFKPQENNTEREIQDSVREHPEKAGQKPEPVQVLADSSFVELATLSDEFVYDMKYATTNNFLSEAVYDCSKCFLRYEVAKALVRANEIFLEKGFRIKLFDCYRPLHVQKKMWQLVPDARYVANPYTSSSYHNRGCAVDLTLADLNGRELDMGTPFDFFGKESHFNYPVLSDQVRLNRDLLREVLESVGFRGITTEWWHFSMAHYPVSDANLCE